MQRQCSDVFWSGRLVLYVSSWTSTPKMVNQYFGFDDAGCLTVYIEEIIREAVPVHQEPQGSGDGYHIEGNRRFLSPDGAVGAIPQSN